MLAALLALGSLPSQCSIGLSCLLRINVYILELLDHEQSALDAEARVRSLLTGGSHSSDENSEPTWSGEMHKAFLLNQRSRQRPIIICMLAVLCLKTDS